MFTAFAIVTLLLYEMLLPAAPVTTWRAERAMKAVEVQSMRDEVTLSSKGNPIGMRVTFEIVFPHAVVANVGLTGPSRVQGVTPPSCNRWSSAGGIARRSPLSIFQG